MCGRFALTLPHDALAQLFDAVPDNDLPEGPRFNICPTDPVAVVVPGAARRLRSMRWGFVPHWYRTVADGPLIVNARADTIATKPAFRVAVRERRCIVPASGFYEWSAGTDGARLPWYITLSDGEPMAFAAIWQHWGGDGEGMDTCAMVTTGGGPNMANIHDREPVILSPADWPLWLGEAGHGAATLMRATGAGSLQSWRVDQAVNSNRAEGERLILPLAA